MLWNGNECGQNQARESEDSQLQHNCAVSKTTGECGIFQRMGSPVTSDARCTDEIKCMIAMAKLAFK
jgi:hypothetical protein